MLLNNLAAISLSDLEKILPRLSSDREMGICGIFFTEKQLNFEGEKNPIAPALGRLIDDYYFVVFV